MPRFFSNKRLILLLVGVIVLVALISFTLRDRHNASLPERIVKDVVGFGQSIFSKPTHFITGVIGNVDGILNTYEENKILKERLNEYASVQAELTEVRIENNELREIIGKKEDLNAYDPIHATVISRNPDQWEEKIILDKGSKHGVKQNMAVITSRGLIGKVIVVTDLHSTVELLSTENRNFRVSAVIRSKENDGQSAFGLIEGFDRERGELIMRRIDTDYEIEIGEKVISSGLGGIFPKGLPIGEVTEVSTDDYGLTKMVYIRPAAQFSMLDHVIITKRTSVTVEGTDGNGTVGAEGEDGS
ncbi:rod shape-determining protein MreC [Sporosarcina pasteurii]|uniref:Cell shape-determining protein MreC n=1 Tax=Sporosarcina pasteurii TaxID=1474 RepID=A0A380BX99_SPOPA|nr:rod shape-determining protein MreC [Sporosarcina pasteurii]MDS9471326.1 rod shape-determining protein MreC [Sporosarcina pasteurii]QBQ05046.1 rod shape-determining protein MreC [Sporosarcina pasteurii]SUJ07654.1 rod shape-determining protein MreC [Sporosarcina pasteurii]